MIHSLKVNQERENLSTETCKCLKRTALNRITIISFFICLAILAGFTTGYTEEKIKMEQLYVCGRNEIYLLDLEDNWTTPKPLWTWQAKPEYGLSKKEVSMFLDISECKPVLGGSHILITSTENGGVALIQKKDKKVIFAHGVHNAHSAELLPDGNIVVASSVDRSGKDGNRLIVFQTNKQSSYSYVPLHSAHGVVYDKKRDRVWGLGYDYLVKYKYDNNKENPLLVEEERYTLPVNDGHDLSWNFTNNKLILSVKKGVYEFDPEEKKFHHLIFFQNISDIKSINVNIENGRLVYVAACKDWWSDHAIFLKPYFKKKAAINLYKVRWDQRNPLAY